MVFMQLKPFLERGCDDLPSREDKSTVDDQVTSFIYNAYHSLPINEQRDRLPIRKYRDQILYCLENYQVLVLVGETGSGKSTQVPQYLFECGWYTKGAIAITESRQVSVLKLAERVALERGEVVGGVVGFVTRFLQQSSSVTKVKYMTEGIILRELLADPLLTNYSVVVIDEAHERNVFTDTLLGLMKKILKKRKSLKLVVSSATIDATFFSSFFDFKYTTRQSNATLSVEGRMHPVKISYAKKPCSDYVRETVETVWKIYKNEPPGGILAFLTGQDEVLEALNLLKEYTNHESTDCLKVYPMYGTLSSHDQLKVFSIPPKGVRKVVLATNIAETSVTVPGIVFVVDCGFVKLKWFNPVNSTDILVVVPISKAIATQRAGRAGRMISGKVYRLYTEGNFANLPEQIPAEMRRTELSSVILHLKSLGINNILRFDFPSAPPAKNLLAALETLYALEAIDERGYLTKPVGYFLAEIPLDPMLSKMLYVSGEMGCSEEIITIIAMLQVQSVFSKSTSKQAQVKISVARRNFEVEEGDLITLLNVFTAFIENNRSKEFCRHYSLVYHSLKRAYEIREQLAIFVNKKLRIPLFSCKGNVEVLRKCITTGFFLNAAYLHHSGVYRKIRDGTELFIHPQSTLYTLHQPQYVIFCELLQTTKLFMNYLTVIKGEWLTELAPNYYHKANIRK